MLTPLPFLFFAHYRQLKMLLSLTPACQSKHVDKGNFSCSFSLLGATHISHVTVSVSLHCSSSEHVKVFFFTFVLHQINAHCSNKARTFFNMTCFWFSLLMPGVGYKKYYILLSPSGNTAQHTGPFIKEQCEGIEIPSQVIQPSVTP